jgi:signal transduction histidine kinase
VARAAVGPALHGEALIDPLTVLQEEVERAGPAAQRAGVHLVLEGPDGPVGLNCNAAELAQMVGELLNNAIKYAPGARVTVAIRLLPATTEIEIADDGPGLTPEDRAAALGRFWRSPRHRDIRGNGLGMTIVQQLAEANGGKLVLAGRKPHGLIARLEFPRREFPRGEFPRGVAGPVQEPAHD